MPMASMRVDLDPVVLKSIKTAAKPLVPGCGSSHLSEALASGFGFNTSVALKQALHASTVLDVSVSDEAAVSCLRRLGAPEPETRDFLTVATRRGAEGRLTHDSRYSVIRHEGGVAARLKAIEWDVRVLMGRVFGNVPVRGIVASDAGDFTMSDNLLPAGDHWSGLVCQYVGLVQATAKDRPTCMRTAREITAWIVLAQAAAWRLGIEIPEDVETRLFNFAHFEWPLSSVSEDEYADRLARMERMRMDFPSGKKAMQTARSSFPDRRGGLGTIPWPGLFVPGVRPLPSLLETVLSFGGGTLRIDGDGGASILFDRAHWIALDETSIGHAASMMADIAKSDDCGCAMTRLTTDIPGVDPAVNLSRTTHPTGKRIWLIDAKPSKTSPFSLRRSPDARSEQGESPWRVGKWGMGDEGPTRNGTPAECRHEEHLAAFLHATEEMGEEAMREVFGDIPLPELGLDEDGNAAFRGGPVGTAARQWSGLVRTYHAEVSDNGMRTGLDRVSVARRIAAWATMATVAARLRGGTAARASAAMRVVDYVADRGWRAATNADILPRRAARRRRLPWVGAVVHDALPAGTLWTTMAKLGVGELSIVPDAPPTVPLGWFNMTVAEAATGEAAAILAAAGARLDDIPWIDEEPQSVPLDLPGAEGIWTRRAQRRDGTVVYTFSLWPVHG